MTKRTLATLPAQRRNHRRRSGAGGRLEAAEERQLSLCFETTDPGAQEVSTGDDAVHPDRGTSAPPPANDKVSVPRQPEVVPAATEPEAVPATSEPDTEFDSDNLLRLPAVKKKTGLGRSTIYADMKKGTFPQPRRISARCVAWSAAAIQQWIDARPETKG